MTPWLTFVIISSIILIIGLIYTLLTKRYPIRVRIVLLFVYFLLGYWGYRQYIIFETERPRISKPAPIIDKAMRPTLPLPIEEEPAIEHYLMSIEKDRPIIIGAPREVQIKFTDPLSPTSPHAIFQIVFENKGTQWAQDINIEWDIKDIGGQGRRITPPDEWARIIGKKKETYALAPRMGFLQIYGPEIGAYAQSDPPNIEVTINVTYKDIKGKQYSYYCRAKTIVEQSENRRYFFNIEDIK